MNSPHIRKSFAFADPLGGELAEVAERCAQAGFQFLENGLPTIDPFEYFAPHADSFSTEELAATAAALLEDGVFSEFDWSATYLAREFAISDGVTLKFTSELLARVAVKFGWAVAYAAELAEELDGGAEISFARAEQPTRPLEHLFIALELRRRKVAFSALALCWPGNFEPAIDFAGEVDDFERVLGTHAAIARFAGPYKLTFQHAEDKFSVLPMIGRECGEQLHAQTSGIRWMEAMRVLARFEPGLFRQILSAAQEHFVFDKMGQTLSTTEDDVRFLPAVPDQELERTFLDDPRGRQLLHVTAPSILAEPMLASPLHVALARHEALHRELVAAQLGRHLTALTGGERAP